MTTLRPRDYGLYEARREHDACGIGAVVDISGTPSRSIVEMANQIVLNLQHRGAAGADESTGDGAGILLQMPDEFLREQCAALGMRLPERGRYGAAMVFLPKDDQAVAKGCEDLLAQAVSHYGMDVMGWRDVPGEPDCLGDLARLAEPRVRQLFIDGRGLIGERFERMLYMARKRAERLAREKYAQAGEDFYVCSMSARTINYKGMFLSPQLFGYYPDLRDERVVSALALIHQRYSTNTFPNWKLAQPFRMVAHNGEINTLSGNRKRMRAREPKMVCPALGDDLGDLFPVLEDGASDSAQFDQCLELLVRAGRSAPHALMMMIPEAFGAAYHISADKRAFYEYHASMMEPWDGPAAMVFTDGRLIGGTLDRNGLRPARYVVTTDGLVVLGSEVGVIEFPPERISQKGRLQPGKMFLVDTTEGRIIVDNEIKSKIARQKPYRRWLEENRIELRGLYHASKPSPVSSDELLGRLRSFGYTREELEMVVKPMACDGQEPVGSMGNDTPLAVLSDQPKSAFNYFKQMFAQVTNPAIDPYREGLVMSTMLFTGKRRNLLEDSPKHCRQLKLPHPILTNEDVEHLRSAHLEDFQVATVEALFDADTGDPGGALRRGLRELVAAAEQAIRDGASLLIVSDRGATERRAPIPSLLACAAVHHGMLRRSLRGEAGIVIESGEPREVMHFCLLCGYGANAINPYLAFDCLHEMRRWGMFPDELSVDRMIDNYIISVKKGILKTMSKMGISTLRSYRSAQLFEAVGLNRELVDEYFTGTTSRIEGVGLEQLAADALAIHRKGYLSRKPGELDLEFGGEYHLRLDGERHLWNAQTVTRMQHAVRNDDPAAYDEFAQAVNDQARRLCTLRGLFDFRFDPAGGVPLDEVEPASEIVKRFCTGAMSHGSISKEAHECLAIAMNNLGGMSNTGEGGEDPARYVRDDGEPDRNSAIKQVASGRFGVTIDYLAHAREIQIKVAQGAKPGEGGQLPGHKVTEDIARLRFSTPGVTLISPPPHHDIYSIEDLAQLIYDLKCSNPGVKVSVKLVSEIGVGTIAAGVAKGNSDEVLISGYDGGTGASPLSSIKHAGVPWELGLAETQQVLVMNGLRDRIRVQADGQMKTGRDIVIAALLGAEQFGFGTAGLVAMGCILMRVCHKGTCPAGIATQVPELRLKFKGKPEHVERYLLFVAEEARTLMAKLGFRTMEEMVGRVDRLSTVRAVDHYKAKGLDFSNVFAPPDTDNGRRSIRRVREQSNTLEDHLDWTILEQIGEQIERGDAAELTLPVRNVNRTVGAILSNRIVTRHGPEGLSDDSIRIDLTGSAGQSFGAWLAPGVTLRLTGDSNDYLGKGLSGGRIVVITPPDSPFEPHENILVGNTLLYGATRGEVYINGLAGERFAVRNSGVRAVVEGVGDHGCEYMTGGVVVVLGRTGRNFAAGMSGGIAYVLDEHQLFDTLCNLDMVDLETVWQQEDIDVLRRMIEDHRRWTGSRRAQWVLDSWREMVGRFVKVMPIDYRKALERQRQREERSAETVAATEEVFGG